MAGLDKFFVVLLALIIGTGIVLSRIDESIFRNYFVVEDGIIEYATAVFLLAISIVSFYRLRTLAAGKRIWFFVTTGFFALIFFFGAGEEISWGQRIFGFETSEFFLEHNYQGETNLHNLMVGETKINKLIFGQLLTLVLTTFFVFIPLLAKWKPQIINLFDYFYVPFPRFYQSATFFVGGFAILLVDSTKKGELNEICLSVLLFLVIYNPLNNIYRASQ